MNLSMDEFISTYLEQDEYNISYINFFAGRWRMYGIFNKLSSIDFTVHNMTGSIIVSFS